MAVDRGLQRTAASEDMDRHEDMGRASELSQWPSEGDTSLELLEPQLVLTLHMIFHELATNACKHGGPQVRKPADRHRELPGMPLDMDFAPAGLVCRFLVEIEPPRMLRETVR